MEFILIIHLYLLHTSRPKFINYCECAGVSLIGSYLDFQLMQRLARKPGIK